MITRNIACYVAAIITDSTGAEGLFLQDCTGIIEDDGYGFCCSQIAEAIDATGILKASDIQIFKVGGTDGPYPWAYDCTSMTPWYEEQYLSAGETEELTGLAAMLRQIDRKLYFAETAGNEEAIRLLKAYRKDVSGDFDLLEYEMREQRTA